MNQSPQKMSTQTTQILWGGLLMSHLMFCFVQVFLSENFEKREPNEQFVFIFAGVGLLLFLAGIYLPGYLSKQTPAPQTAEDKIQKHGKGFILRWALFEAVALQGFALAFLQNDVQLYFPFAALALAAHLTQFPTQQKLEAGFN